MNDPHVEALYYKVVTGPHCDFDNAPPLDHQTQMFDVSLADGRAIFRMKEHFAIAEEARAVVQPFVDAWEVKSGLINDPGDFQLVYENAEIIDRSPTPGATTLHAAGFAAGTSVDTATAHVSRAEFPEPPDEFEKSPEVAAMYYQYTGYRKGQMELAAVANLCLTVLEKGRGRMGAAKHFQIDPKILSMIGNLTANKGGPGARKASGLDNPYQPKEREWLEAAMKVLIRRAGERAASTKPLPMISKADLPSI
jgi:hypothetical protein